MITLPSELDNFMKGKDLTGLKPFAFLFRNKWDEVNNKYAIDTTPIDISGLIVKPNTLSMTLDVNEVAQYNANNVTITLSDTKNYFVEGTPNSYFPEGYQVYGSRVVLYYGTDATNRTPLFTGVIKDLPTYKPEKYQVELKLVSPLEMLKDIEARDFSNKVTGEILTYVSSDSSGHRIYQTAGTGVGGFTAVYAGTTKLFEGVDYEIGQTSVLGLPATVKIINDVYYSSTISADYYTWKTALTVEQIVTGLMDLAGYDSGNEDIRTVIWNTGVRSQVMANALFSVGFRDNNPNFNYSGNSCFYGSYVPARSTVFRYNKFPTNYTINAMLGNPLQQNLFSFTYDLGDFSNGNLYNGFSLQFTRTVRDLSASVYKFTNGTPSALLTLSALPTVFSVTKNGNSITITLGSNSVTSTVNFTGTGTYNERLWNRASEALQVLTSYSLTSDGITLSRDGVVFYPITQGNENTWTGFTTTMSNADAQYELAYRTSDDGSAWTNLSAISIGSNIGVEAPYIQFKMQINSQTTDILNPFVGYLSSTLLLQLVVLSDKSVLESLQDFSLISGYEFGVDRRGVFFFRPRVSSTTPTYILGHEEIVKVDTVKKNLSDFFTKLTLTFAQVPLEFYANTGDRPTPIDRYGVINKEIDKPDIVNYDNPELAQAIGPQLLEVYSSLPNVIQVTGKLNLALELGDIVSLRRNMNLITPENYTDYSKYNDLNTYYRACKITGMNYNFAKRQITYTLRDVSNKNTEPQYEFNEYIYDLAVQYGVKE